MNLRTWRLAIALLLAAVAGFCAAWFYFPSRVVQKNPPGESSYPALGRSALARMEYTPAAYYLERAALLEPEQASTWYYLGQAHFFNDQPREAMRAFEQVLWLDPPAGDSLTIEAMQQLAMLYTRHNMPGPSRKLFEALLQLEQRPDRAAYLRNQLAELDLTEGHYRDDGNAVYNDRGEVIGGVGEGDMRTNRHFEIARHTDDLREKEIHFKKAIESDPGMHQAYFNVGLSLTRQSRFHEALSCFEQSNRVWLARSDINPAGLEKASAYAYMGHCYTGMGMPQKAREHCEKALQLDPEYFYAHLFLAEALLALSQKEAAGQLLKELLLANPDDAEITGMLWEALPAARKKTAGQLCGLY